MYIIYNIICIIIIYIILYINNIYYICVYAAAAAGSLQSCPTLCNPKNAAHEALPSLGFSRLYICNVYIII